MFLGETEPVSAERRPAQSAVDRKCYYGLVARASVVHLATPPVARLVPDGVFDAFGWCASDVLEWRAPEGVWDDAAPIDGSDPARMVFVFVQPGAAAFLPRELASLHAFGLGLTDEEALAPWAIDDATDGLYARGLRPRDALWLAADNLNALFWGLHDWAHFHSHGPFEQRAWTELQCDATALAWLWENRARVPRMTEATWEKARRSVLTLARARFAGEGGALDEALLDRGELQALCAAAGDCARITRS
jgi:hypothetical protein